MDWPYHFPHPADVIAEEAERTRRLSVEDRLAQLAELVAAGELLVEHPAARLLDRRLRQRSEAAWRRAQREVFARHAG